MWRSNLCDHSGAYIVVSETITFAWAGANDAANN